MKTDNIVALFCITAIVITALWLDVDGAKELALALGGGVSGWMAKEKM